MVEVTVRTKYGGITLGKMDDQGRLVYLAGYWVPIADSEVRDKYLRQYVAEIIEDGGATYKLEVARIVPNWW
jgi:hypothetical protein